MVELSFDHYQDYDEMTDILQTFAKEFPDLSELYSIGQSTEGRNLCLKADVTLFAPATIKQNASNDDPCNWATRVSTVIVNGRIEFDDGKHTEELAGKMLRLN